MSNVNILAIKHSFAQPTLNVPNPEAGSSSASPRQRPSIQVLLVKKS